MYANYIVHLVIIYTLPPPLNIIALNGSNNSIIKENFFLMTKKFSRSFIYFMVLYLVVCRTGPYLDVG